MSGNKIISVGYNNEHGHAEVNALLKLKSKKKLKKISLLVLRIKMIDNNLTFAMSKPCINCVKSIIFLSEKRRYDLTYIYYSTYNNDFIRITKDDLYNDNSPYKTKHQLYNS